MTSPSPSRLYLLRHAKSGWAEPGQKDFDRQLDAQGFAEAELVADKAADLGYRPDRVLCSTATRCRQTADAIRRATDETIEPNFVDELYNGSLPTYLSLIESQQDAGSVMIIGHNPTMEELLEALVGPTQMLAAVPSSYPPAGLVVLDRNTQASGAGADWILTDFLTP
ncbi:histidine phosphatase family protein [Rhizobium sp. NTR19]|uniref:Histidine phosphatase family protein n=1 Tax=Neorhizobium turbinariae TaxID=2937795 RepID=A0ABT0IWV6_9HYPH|nr:histidine phosphatase family protein [Neorhizobium turbinariae]MCK8782368.1 histidine phosphatase family protein [Neorhizobium turbinariae]